MNQKFNTNYCSITELNLIKMHKTNQNHEFLYELLRILYYNPYFKTFLIVKDKQ